MHEKTKTKSTNIYVVFMYIFYFEKRQNYACLPVKSQAELVYVLDIYTCRYS